MPTRARRAALGCAVLLTTTISLTAPGSPASAAVPDPGAASLDAAGHNHGATPPGAAGHNHGATPPGAAVPDPVHPASTADTTPPTRPGLSIARDVSLTWATVTVLYPSSDDTGVAGYLLQWQVDGVWTDAASNNITSVYLRELTPATTYTVRAVAFDAAGNRSPGSDPVTFTTRAVEPAPTCRVDLTSFGTGYLANVMVENMTLTPVPGWFVTFTLPASHTVLNTAGASVARSGEQARLNPSSWSATLASGGRPTIMVNAAKPVSAPEPSEFRLNGTIACPITD